MHNIGYLYILILIVQTYFVLLLFTIFRFASILYSSEPVLYMWLQ